MKLNKQYGLNKVANKMVKQLDKFQQLRDIVNRSNYSHKLKKLHEKLIDEVDLWERKGPSNRLSDLKHDLNSIQLQIEATEVDKIKVDQLASKYLRFQLFIIVITTLTSYYN